VTSVAEAMTRLMNERISSLYICPPSSDQNYPGASETGIITERDILRAVATHGDAALQMPVDQLMSKPLAAVPADSARGQ
jgi:CBS domain-containing protein